MDQDDKVVLVVVQMVRAVAVHGDLEVVAVAPKVLLVLVGKAQEEVFPKVMVMVDLVQTVVKVEIVTLPSTRLQVVLLGFLDNLMVVLVTKMEATKAVAVVAEATSAEVVELQVPTLLVVVEVLGTITHHMLLQEIPIMEPLLSGQMILKGVVCQDQQRQEELFLTHLHK